MAIYQNKPIKSLSGEVFSLDDGDFTILYNFAMKGEATRHQIITTQDKKTVSKKNSLLRSCPRFGVRNFLPQTDPNYLNTH